MFGTEAYYNSELYSNVLYVDNNDIKAKVDEKDLEYLKSTQLVSQSALTQQQLGYIQYMLALEDDIPAQSVDMYDMVDKDLDPASLTANTNSKDIPATVGFPVGLAPYIEKVVQELYVCSS